MIFSNIFQNIYDILNMHVRIQRSTKRKPHVPPETAFAIRNAGKNKQTIRH